MSFLAIAFGLGSLAVGLPIIFHLIRRSPQRRIDFSSLRFLQPSPPRLTRRNRIEDWLLLLLRGTAIVLVTLAFMRPLIRDAALVTEDDLVGRRVVILIDTSASMRQPEAWANAQAAFREQLAGLRPRDDFAVVAFDSTTRVIIPFDEPTGRSPPMEKRDLAKAALDELAPTWFETDVGNAFSQAVELLESQRSAGPEQVDGYIVLISDLQSGASFEALAGIEWPAAVRVDVRCVVKKQRINAVPKIMVEPGGIGARPRIRIARSDGAGAETFSLVWQEQASEQAAERFAIDVPAGSMRTIEKELPASGQCFQLALSGDEVDFDNIVYLARPTIGKQIVLFVGDEGLDDPAALGYFLKRAISSAHFQVMQVSNVANWEAGFGLEPIPLPLHSQPTSAVGEEGATFSNGPVVSRPALVVVAKPLPDEQRRVLADYAASGGIVLVCVNRPDVAASLASLTGAVPESNNQDADTKTTDVGFHSKYRLLIDVDMTHPWLAPFASPQFSNFTKIRFWRTCPVRGNEHDLRVIARFDDERPAMWENPIGTGRVIGLASSWHPDDSQLGLSSKFVPLMKRLVELNPERRPVVNDLVVGESWPIPTKFAGKKIVITRPDGTLEECSAEVTEYRKTELPGIYRVQAGDDSERFAVNPAASESKLEPVPLDQLKSWGVPMEAGSSIAQEIRTQQFLNDQAVESRQRIWKWLIVAALIVLTIESWLAAWQQRRRRLESTSGAHS